MKFKPTLITFIILALICVWCILNFPINMLFYPLFLTFCSSFIFFHFGKLSEEKRSREKELQIQLDQIQEILDLPIVKLFPDVEEVLKTLHTSKIPDGEIWI
jgi:hypothetical protein